jgi:hypothetical protein
MKWGCDAYLEYVQVQPATQVVAPVHPVPPPFHLVSNRLPFKLGREDYTAGKQLTARRPRRLQQEEWE